jgi:acyl-CoA synthetase (AMP-forming)/AMP-acid ligase II
VSLFSLLSDAPRDRIALHYGDESWSYGALYDASLRVAGGLTALGLRPGDRLAYFLSNCPELVLGYFGAFAAGVIGVPLNPRYQGAEVEHAVADSRPRALIADAALLPRLDVARLAALGIEAVVVIGAPAPAATQPFATLSAAPPRATPAVVSPQGDAVILYTSGSTAAPKGVTHTHGSLGHAARHQVATQQLSADDVQLAWMGIAYIAAFVGQLLPSLALGARTILLPHFEPATALDAIARWGATRLQSGPTDLRDLLDYPATATADLSSLRACLAGGEQIHRELHQRFAARTGFALTEACGMTELYNYASNPPFGAKRLGSIGHPTAGVSMRLVDRDGRDADAGEIWVRSDAMMRGYWNNAEATAAAMGDGWLRSGDLARRDADGWLWFVGRSKHIIIRGASNIAPGEVEAVLVAHPAVVNAGVVGAPDPREGHVPVAFVQLHPGAAVAVAALRDFAAARLAAYKVPVRIEIVAALPLNATGKVDRVKLQSPHRLRRGPFENLP